MMKKTLYIHIGSQKTGSTSIQRFLFLNRIELRNSHKISIPSLLGDETGWHYWMRSLAYPSAHALHGLRESESTAELEVMLDRFHAWMEKETSEVTIVSDEHLCSAGAHYALGLKNLFEPYFDDIRVILYLRDPISSVLSWLSTQILGRFKYVTLNRESIFPDLGPNGTVWRLFDPRVIVKDWLQIFPGCVTVNPYSATLSKPNGVISDFAETIGFQYTDLPYKVGRHNTSVPFDALKRLWFYDRLFDADNHHANWLAVRPFIVKNLAHFSDKNCPARLISEEYRLFSEHFAEGKEYYEQKFPEKKNIFSLDKNFIKSSGKSDFETVSINADKKIHIEKLKKFLDETDAQNSDVLKHAAPLRTSLNSEGLNID